MTKKFKSFKAEYQTKDCHSSRPAITRRDFLARSAGASASLLFTPSLFSMITQDAFGACGDLAGASVFPPFICVDLAGGGNLAGSNVIVGGRGGQSDYLADYSTLGVTPPKNPLVGDFSRSLVSGGLEFHAESAFFEGMRRELNNDVAKKVDGVVFCARSGDDTQNNPHNPLYWIAKAQIMFGQRGKLTNLIGTNGSTSGGNATAPVRSIDPMLRPVQINSAADAKSLVDVGLLPDWLGMGSTAAKKDRAVRVLAAVNRMSSSQLDKFSAQDLPTQVRSLVDCGYLKSQKSVTEYFAAPNEANPTIDASADPDLIPIFALNNQDQTPVAAGGSNRTRSTQASDKLRSAAGVAKLVLDGLAAAGTITYGGYDYHNGARGTTDDRDRQAGHVVGALINAAAKKGKDLVIYLFTDGGLSASTTQQTSAIRLDPDANATNVQKFQFTGDNGTKSCAVLLAYRHSELSLATKHQIGWYNANQSVERSASLVSDNVENLSKAIVANYLALAGKEGDLAKVVGDNPFGGGMNDILALQNWKA
jgi:hypothetical protein